MTKEGSVLKSAWCHIFKSKLKKKNLCSSLLLSCLPIRLIFICQLQPFTVLISKANNYSHIVFFFKKFFEVNERLPFPVSFTTGVVLRRSSFTFLYSELDTSGSSVHAASRRLKHSSSCLLIIPAFLSHHQNVYLQVFTHLAMLMFQKFIWNLSFGIWNAFHPLKSLQMVL